jgi:ABC-type transport system involved in multi-copper enzyme maturation permease subunit
MSLFRTRWGLVMFFLCSVPGIGRLVMLLIVFGVVRFGQLRAPLPQRASGKPAELDPFNVEFYVDPVLWVMPGMIVVLMLSSLVTARAIARDRMMNALELYWTRGISPRAYLFAKWLGSFMLVSLLTVAVPLVLWLTAVLLADDWSLLTDTAAQLGLVLTGLACVTAVWTGICILISAMCASANTAMVLWSMLLVGSSALGAVLSRLLREPWLASGISVWDAGAVIVRSVAGIPQANVSVPGAAFVLGGLLALLLVPVLRRLRLAEAVA